jgi:hypothetical protein
MSWACALSEAILLIKASRKQTISFPFTGLVIYIPTVEKCIILVLRKSRVRSQILPLMLTTRESLRSDKQSPEYGQAAKS